MTKAANLADRRPRREWIRHRERGSIALLRIMAFRLAALGPHAEPRSAVRHRHLLLFVRTERAAPFAALFAPRARPGSPRARDRFRQILSFATTIHDRVYLINEQFEQFNITLEGEDAGARAVARAAAAPCCLGAHMGSFEVMHSLGRRQRGLARRHGHVRGECAQDQRHPRGHQSATWMPTSSRSGQIDAMLQYRRASRSRRLRRRAGRSHAGRRAGAGGDLARRARVLAHRTHARGGHPALPGVLHGRPVSRQEQLSRGVRAGRRFFRDSRRRRAASRCAPRSSATPRVLDQYCRSDPYNWFNFFDFWRPPARAARA